MKSRWKTILKALRFVLLSCLFLGAGIVSGVRAQDVMSDMAFFGSIADRSTGTPGSEKAADYILHSFEDAGLSQVGVQKFLTPVPELISASMEVEGETLEIFPWGPNMAYLPMTPEKGIRAPLVYVGNGDFDRLDGKTVKDSIVLMEMDSHSNWLNAVMLGARALIYLGKEDSVNGEFREKNTPTPLAFPRFWIRPEIAERLKRVALERTVEATVISRTRWQNKLVRNIYGFIPGKDPGLRHELVILDAFYDASSPVLGLAPGAGEATSMAILLTLARTLAKEPPDRTVLFLATTGNGQSLAGMRQFIWSITTRRKLLRKELKRLQAEKRRVDRQLELIRKPDPFSLQDPDDRDLLWQVIAEEAKNKSDELTREKQYRKLLSRDESPTELDDARPYRRIAWLQGLEDLSPDQQGLALQLMKNSLPGLKATRQEVKLRRDAVRSTSSLKGIVDEYQPVFLLSLYLSSHSPYSGLVEMGETYPVRENVRRMVRAGRLVNLLSQAGQQVEKETGLPNIIREASRGGFSEEGFGKGHATTHPCCDVGALAGLPAVSLMTLDDYRAFWSTPNDTPDRLNRDNLQALARFLPPLFANLLSHPTLSSASEGGIRGLASLEGQAKFIRQGELFPDQPAPGTIISVMQG